MKKEGKVVRTEQYHIPVYEEDYGGLRCGWHILCALDLEKRLVPLYGRPYNVLRHYRNGFLANFNKTKKHKYSFASADFYKYPSTTLKNCDVCGKLGTPKKIMHRSQLYRWNVDDKKDYTTPSKDMLCMGCWNKLRVLVNKQHICNENRKLISKIKLEIAKWVKLQQQVS